MFADAPIDPTGGWAQLLLQGGAFGLLTYIVVWLAPVAMREARLERENHDAKFVSLVDAMHAKFEERNLQIVSAVEKQTNLLIREFEAIYKRNKGDDHEA